MRVTKEIKDSFLNKVSLCENNIKLYSKEERAFISEMKRLSNRIDMMIPSQLQYLNSLSGRVEFAEKSRQTLM